MFETKSILETLLYKSFYFKLQVFAVYFRRTYVYFRSTYVYIKTFLVIDVVLVHKIQLTGNCQLLPSS